MERSNDDKAAEQREARMRTLRNDVKVRANQYGLKIDKEDADVFAMNDFYSDTRRSNRPPPPDRR